MDENISELKKEVRALCMDFLNIVGNLRDKGILSEEDYNAIASKKKEFVGFKEE